MIHILLIAVEVEWKENNFAAARAAAAEEGNHSLLYQDDF
jgi:hypothetical protein